MIINEKGMRIYIILLKRLCIAWRGSRSVRITNAITTAISSLVQRLREINGMSDQRVLTSMYPNSNHNQGLSLTARDQTNLLETSINTPRQRIAIRKYWSNGLPASLSPPPNHRLKGRLAAQSIQLVGTHKAMDSLGFCLYSISSRRSTKTVQMSRAIDAGMETTYG